ncbi:MAG: hypothetical protein ACP5G6_08615 [Conexivisphaera sp.]
MWEVADKGHPLEFQSYISPISTRSWTRVDPHAWACGKSSGSPHL